MNTALEEVSDSTARRAAQKVGLVAKKSRRGKDTWDNQGGFMVVDPSRNQALDGWRYDMSAEEVVEFCKGME